MREQILSATGLLIMCMNNNVQQSCQNSTTDPQMIKTEQWSPNVISNPISSPETSVTSVDDNDIIEFGPIKVKRRRKPAPTLATGRRSKYEVLTPDEAYKRDVRRARNRAAAERVRINRLNVEHQLQSQINELESQEKNLIRTVEMLQCQKLQLETRILTHDRYCRSNSMPNVQPYSEPAFVSTSVPTTTACQQVSSFCFEELFDNIPTPVQTSMENLLNPSINLIPSDDLDIFLMDL